MNFLCCTAPPNVQIICQMLSVYHFFRALFIAHLLYVVIAKWKIEESVIEKDLYKILGLPKTASLKEIQKAFRKLAQKHHPDKAKPDNVKYNESIFRALAEAYEVLSTKSQREEYDTRRKLLQRDGLSNRKDSTDPPHSPGFYNSDVFSSDDLFGDFDEGQDNFAYPQNPDYFQPSVTGPFLNAKQIIFPYDPILATIGRHTFALLDETCSIVIYQGDLEVYIRNTLLYGTGLGVNNSASFEFDELYRTSRFPMLGGNCFAGLDDAGYLHIFRGQPVGSYHSVWSSSKHDHYGTFGFERYQLQLLREGELRIHEVRAVEKVCVWSSASASCNAYLSSARMAVTKTHIALRKACTLANLLQLPGQIANSNLVKYIQSSLFALQRKLRVKVLVMLCYVKHTWKKYIMQRESDNAGLNECLSETDPLFTKGKDGARKRRAKSTN